MSSSTSSSDARDAGWRGFLETGLLTAAGVFLMLLGGVAALDPFDTARFALVEAAGVPHQGPRTANASRGRDPAFDAAIVGNSHVQLLTPGRLNQATGLAFVSLVAEGTGPREQLAMLRWFLKHRARPPGAIVLGLDGAWCARDLPLAHPFPFWLYEDDRWAYLAGLVRLDVLERTPARLAQLFGRGALYPRDGFRDYEADPRLLGRTADLQTADLQTADLQAAAGAPTMQDAPHAGPPPALGLLQAALRTLPDETALVLLRPPVHVSALPRSGAPAARADEACRDAFAGYAASRPRTALADWRTDRPESREAANWLDSTHYRAGLARAIEADVTARLSAMRARPDRHGTRR